MEVLLGSPPPPPPENVPDLEETKDTHDGKLISVAAQMAAHRANPACSSCHNVIDPIGLSLDNFDVTGAWRIKDRGVPITVTSELYDGTPLNGRYWVFYGALSSVEYTIKVTDTTSGTIKTYRNTSGQLASVGDTGAF